MNCKKHPEQPAVNKCEVCGSGICSDCYNATKGYGTMCLDCACAEAKDDITAGKKLVKKLLTKSILLMIFWCIGISLFILGAVTKASTELIIGLLICGLPTAIAFWRKGADEHDAWEAKHGANYTITDSGIYKDQGYGTKFFYAAVGLILGLAANPFKVIKNIMMIKDLKESIPMLESSIARWAKG